MTIGNREHNRPLESIAVAATAAANGALGRDEMDL